MSAQSQPGCAPDGATPAAQPSAHTPGPWSYERGARFHADVWVVTAQGMGADTPLARLQDFDEAAEPDARLIAAAPDLAHEAREVCAILDNYSGHDGETLVYDYEAIGEEVARRHASLTAALAKATGEA